MTTIAISISHYFESKSETQVSTQENLNVCEQ